MAATVKTVVFILILAILFSSAVYATLQAPSSSSAPQILTCTEELVMFSPCLPYVSAPPNNISETPNPICCSVFTSSIHSSAGNCLCYLLRQPMILGFPLDRSRLISLSQICTDRSSDESFESRCSPSESPELPPLQSIQFTNPFVPGNGGSASPQSVGLAPEISPSSDQFSPETAAVTPPPPPAPQYISSSSPKIRNFWSLSTIIMTLATSILLTRICMV
ncbi:PREDICTED: non-specific lipid transfer protein GPI-anchored 2-like [Camelina sativa]|uniref:Non-specific lipid transfer protein GPI-anchored 2-like n=1 Tax=Camelina sativa TaxID=90675 RepID=A0ABM0V2X1_CAMSA|nr:PREDICTED: non-specific lipid transfer protein GPI-anchored 2-like [Camelina sativa]